MGRARLTCAAERDLDAIADRIARDKPSAAENWLREMYALFEILAAQPEMSEQMITRRFGKVRRHSRGKYNIYYRALSDGVRILRVMHGARDQEKLV